MVQLHSEQSSADTAWHTFGGEVPRNRVRLPYSVVLAAVGDFDLVNRLSQHQHFPLRPGWSCSSCPAQWPCLTAKQDLLLDLGWVRLAVYCSVLLERAVKDLPDTRPRDLWARFIEWTFPIDGPQDARLSCQV